MIEPLRLQGCSRRDTGRIGPGSELQLLFSRGVTDEEQRRVFDMVCAALKGSVIVTTLADALTVIAVKTGEIEQLRTERDFARRERDRACQETREVIARETANLRATF